MTQNQGHGRWFVFLICSAAILFGCHKAERAQPTASAADAKAEIDKFLVRKSGQKGFTPGINLELPKELAALRSHVHVLEQRAAALRTATEGQTAAQHETSAGKAQRVLIEKELDEVEQATKAARAEVSRKEDELSRQENTYINAVRQQISGVRTYEALYRLIGQQLATADRLLAEADLSRRRMGLSFAREALGHANSDPEDAWLAARICEAYLWPNLDLADSKPGSRERALDMLETCRRVFFVTHETNNVLKNYNLMMTNAPDARAADTYRVQFADWLEERGNVKWAAEILNEIRDASVLASAEERITRVKERIAAAP